MEQAKKRTYKRRKKNTELALQTMQECMREILQKSVKDEEEQELLRKFGIEPQDAKWAHVLAKKLFDKAQGGDMVAFKELLNFLEKESKQQSENLDKNADEKNSAITKFEEIVQELQSGE